MSIKYTRLLKTEHGDVYDFGVKHDTDFQDAYSYIHNVLGSAIDENKIYTDFAYSYSKSNKLDIDALSSYVYSSYSYLMNYNVRIDSEYEDKFKTLSLNLAGLAAYSYETFTYIDNWAYQTTVRSLVNAYTIGAHRTELINQSTQIATLFAYDINTNDRISELIRDNNTKHDGIYGSLNNLQDNKLSRVADPARPYYNRMYTYIDMNGNNILELNLINNEEHDLTITGNVELTGGERGNDLHVSGNIISNSLTTQNDITDHGDLRVHKNVAEGYNTEASGTYSHAEGYNSKATAYAYTENTLQIGIEGAGNYTHAEGNATIANGCAAHAEGVKTLASGIGSHAEGCFTYATGPGAHAEGVMNVASGPCSHAEGQMTYAVGTHAHSEGYSTYALDDAAHAEGQDTEAKGRYSHAEGYNTKATTYAYTSNNLSAGDSTSGYYTHAEGNATIANGCAAHAEGVKTLASGIGSHAEGNQTVASNLYSHAEGNQTVASNLYSHAEGNNTQAIREASHAEGSYTHATADFSHAEGWQTIAEGQASHAEGSETYANGTNSHAEGHNTTAEGDYSHAEGDLTAAIGVASHVEGQGIYYDSENLYNWTNDSRNIYIVDGTINDIDKGIIIRLDKEFRKVTNVNVEQGFFEVNENPSSTKTNSKVKRYSTGIAFGDYSHSESYGNAIGTYTHAEGWVTFANEFASHAEGYFTQSNGTASHAEGIATTSSEEGTHSEGFGTEASGRNSHAEGSSTKAIGVASHSEGKDTQAPGDYSHAEGLRTQASGAASHAEGKGTIAKGDYSHAEGQSTKVTDTGGHVEGIGTTTNSLIKVRKLTSEEKTAIYNKLGINFNYIAVTYDGNDPIEDNCVGDIYSDPEYKNYITEITISFYVDSNIHPTLVGDVFNTNLVLSGVNENTPINLYYKRVTSANGAPEKSNGVHVEGYGTQTIYGGIDTYRENNRGAHAEGCNTVAASCATHAEGSNTGAYGRDAHAEGQHTLAYGGQSHAEGMFNISAGVRSHAEGEYTLATGIASHTEGLYTKALGNVAHAEGQSTKANKPASHAEGYGTLADDYYTHVEGWKTTASKRAAHSEGTFTYACGLSSHAEGLSTYKMSNRELNSMQIRKLTSDEQTAIKNKYGKIYNYISDESVGDMEDGTHGWTITCNSVSTTITSSMYVHVSDDTLGTIDGDAFNVESQWDNITNTYVPAFATYPTEYGFAGGQFSHVEGYDTIAGDDAAHAEGDRTKATNEGAHAEGSKTESTGKAAHAEGESTVSSGTAAHAEGHKTYAQGDYSHAEGYGSYTFAQYSHAEGNTTYVLGNGSHAEGYRSIAIGQYSHVEGITDNPMFGPFEIIPDVDWTNDTTLIINKYNSDFTNSAVDHLNKVKKVIFFKSDGSAIVAEIQSTDRIDTQTGPKPKLNFNINTSAFRSATSILLGCGAIGNNTHVEGLNTIALGENSHAEGNATMATGANSHASGLGTIATDNMTAVGTYNTTPDNALFVVGNGTGTDSYRKNAFTVTKSSVEFNIPTTIISNSTNSNAPYIFVGKNNFGNYAGLYNIVNGETAYMRMAKYNTNNTTKSEIAANNIQIHSSSINTGEISIEGGKDIKIGDGTTSTYVKSKNTYIGDNSSTNIVYIKGQKYTPSTSDVRLKNIISDIDLNKGYEMIEKCQTVLYSLKDDADTKQQIGLIAQEVQEFFPEIVDTNTNGYLYINYDRLAVILLRVMKSIIDRLKVLESK